MDKRSPVVMNSMVHWQRHSCAVIRMGVDKHGVAYRLSVLPVDSKYDPRTDVLPFDVFFDLGAKPRRAMEQESMKTAIGYSAALNLFDKWFDECKLGVSKFERKNLFIPIFESVEQMNLARNFWSHGIYDEFFTPLPRITELAIATHNDACGMQAKYIEFGKNTTSQCASRLGLNWEKDNTGLIRCVILAQTYKALITQVS